MKVFSSSLLCILTIPLLTIPVVSQAVPSAEPTVTTVRVGDDAQSKIHTYTFVPDEELAQLEQMEMGAKKAREALSRVTRQRDAVQERSTQLAAANAELKAQLAAARAELDEARREAVAVRRAHEQELKQARHATAEARRELHEVRQVLAQTEQRRDEQQRELERLQGDLASGREAFDLLASLRDQVKAAATEVQGLKSDVMDVRGELQAPAKRRALKTQVERLEQERQQLNEQLASQRQRLAALAHRQEALEQSVAARDAHKRELLKTIIGLEDRLETAQARLVQARHRQQAAPAETAERRKQTEEHVARRDPSPINATP